MFPRMPVDSGIPGESAAVPECRNIPGTQKPLIALDADFETAADGLDAGASLSHDHAYWTQDRATPANGHRSHPL